MKIYFCTYSDFSYLEKRKMLSKKASLIFDQVLDWTPESIKDSSFYNKNLNIFKLQRGIGFWIWKPYIIKKSLEKMNYGDILFYLDSGDTFSTEIKDFICMKSKNMDIFITPSHNLQKKYTKRDCFILMNCDSAEYWNAIQIEAGILILKKTEFNEKLIDEWLSYCEDERILTDCNNLFDVNFEEFIDHRHDQSILSNLIKKYNIPMCNETRNYVVCNVV